jgi:hypothetical protein
MASIPSKDTIYIDIDDEITGIIDKMRASNGRVVALVLPKRAAVLQSIVNMRLLKRSADEAKQHVVLITSEAGLLPLAGAAGMYVAKTLTSKPEIPTAPDQDDSEETVDEDSSEPDSGGHEVTAATAGSMAVGALAGIPPSDEVETVELDDDTSPEDEGDDAAGAEKPKPSKPPKVKKDKKLAVPNFERFRLLLALGGLILILLIVGVVMASDILPKATVNIKTDATNINASLSLNLSTTASSLNPSNGTVPATLVQRQKTYTQQAATTGKQNEGTKANGSVDMTAVECAPDLSQPADVPAGTGVSTNGLTYITQQDTSFNPFGKGKGSCITYQATQSSPITAQSAGANYNTNASSYTVAGRPDITASVDSAPTGGTDNIVQVVSQSDIDGAKSKISTNDTSVKQALQSQLQGQSLFAIPATFSAGTPTVTTSANVGDASSTVTVTEVVTYTMFGVHQSDLKTLVDSNVNNQIDTAKQSILSEGLSSASFSVQTSSSTGAQLGMQTTAVAGPQLNIVSIKQEVAGKKSGDVISLLKADPDVTDVNVKLSPFWVTTVPTKTSKITIDVAKPTTTASSSNASNP